MHTQSRHTQQIDVLDMLIEIIKEHEHKLDQLITKLENTQNTKNL